MRLTSIRFEGASILRKALKGLFPPPTEEALQLAARLHEHLILNGAMYSFWDPRFGAFGLGESSRAATGDAGR